MAVTYWRQPGNKTMKRQTGVDTKHIPTHRAEFEIELFIKSGYTVTDFGHKIEVKKIKQE